MRKHEHLAKEIVEKIGGEENVLSLTHCITRLRFKLKDESAARDEAIRGLSGVVTVMKSGGQYQVVIGNQVAEVYEEVCLLLKLPSGEGATAQPPENGKEEKLLDRFVDVVSGIFQPILGLMAACGMVKGLNVLFAVIGLYPDTGGAYRIFNAVGDALFTFLPLFLGYTSAQKFGLKPMLGLAVGAIMCYPGVQAATLAASGQPLYTLFADSIFANNVYSEFFGVPIIFMNYTGTVVPVIFVVYFAAFCERRFKSFVPDLVKFFMVPMFTLLAALSVGLLLIGPTATFASNLTAEFVLALRDVSPLVAGAVVGATWQILVIFGLHWGFIPVYINNMMTLGYDNVMMPFFACTFATSAVVLAIFIKTKDKHLKEMALPNFISGIFGVTEPAIYGILLPLKTPFIISCIAGGIGGGFYGLFNFRKFMMGGMGIFELPAMVEPNGSLDNLIVAAVGMGITMLIAFVMTMALYRDQTPAAVASVAADKAAEERTSESAPSFDRIDIASPMKGRVLRLGDVRDAAFSSGVLGRGAAILPSEGRVISPLNGTVAMIFPTGHALGLISDEGVEMLIHIGLDTVQLEGRGFVAQVKSGDRITIGQTLLEFDMELIARAGYSLETPVLISNTAAYSAVLADDRENVDFGERLLCVVR